MQASTSTLETRDGAQVFVYQWAPENAPRGVIHIVHGMAEHAARYARLASALTEAGFVVYAHDHRGHGRTANETDRGHLADEDGWLRALDDIRALIAREKAARAGLPFVLMGHSMGSFMVQELLFELSGDLTAAILSGTNGKPSPIAAAGRVVARAERMRLGGRGHSRLLASLSFETFNKAFRPNRTPFDWLSRDDAEVDQYVADPLCGFECSTSTWVELLDALGRIAVPESQARIRKDLPLYVFAGANDAMSENAKGVRKLLSAYQHAGLSDVTHHIYEGARHETLNETNRDEVTRDLVTWISSRAK
jgi:alpha-beta hydrolase superfamily lysophospholipase